MSTGSSARGEALEDIMSITPIGGRLFDGSGQKITTATLRSKTPTRTHYLPYGV
jgi:hypothetical protein